MAEFRNVIFIFLLAALAAFSSCGVLDDPVDDDDALDPQFAFPTVVVETTVSTQFDTVLVEEEIIEVEPLNVVTFDVSIIAEAGFVSYSIFLSVNGAVSDTLIEVRADDLDSTPESRFVNDSKSFEIPSELVNTTAGFTFLAVDQAEQTGEDVVTLEVLSPRVRQYAGVTLYSLLEDPDIPSFFAASSGKTYSSKEILEGMVAPEDIDFGFYYGEIDSATIASPRGFEKTAFFDQVEEWSSLNATNIRSTELSSLTDIERFEDIDAVYEGGTDESGIVANAEKDQVIAFETVKGRRGLVLIKSIYRGINATSDDPIQRRINLEVKVQERVPRE